MIDDGIDRLIWSGRPRGGNAKEDSTRIASVGAHPAAAATARASRSGAIDPAAFLEMFRRNRFSPKATAAELGIPRTTVYSLIERHPDIPNINTIPIEELRRQHAECGGDLDRLAERLGVSRRGLQLRISQVFKETPRRGQRHQCGFRAIAIAGSSPS